MMFAVLLGNVFAPTLDYMFDHTREA